jgi:O-antigen/teichoic acid export membrane protein
VPRLAPHVRFALVFFASQVLLAAFQAGGETLVRLVTGDYAEVAQFAVASGIYGVAAASMMPLAWSLAPLLGGHVDRGDRAAVAAWIDRLLRAFAAAGVGAVLGALFLADHVTPLVFGAAYAPAAANVLPLALALTALGLGTATSLLSLLHDRPGEALVASALRLAVFVSVGGLLAARWGSLGACIAVAAASAIHAAYSAWRMRGELGGATRRWLHAVALGAIPLPLVWLRASPAVDLALCAAAVAMYAVGLRAAGLVTARDVRGLRRVLRRRSGGAPADPA